MKIAIGGNHKRDRFALSGNHRCRAVDNTSNGSIFHPNDSHIRNQRTEPVEKIQDLWPADPREEILVSTREADNLVWKHRTKDQQDIVVGNARIDLDRHIQRQQAARNL